MKVLLHKQTGENALLCPSLSSSLALALGSSDSAQSQSSAYSRSQELGSGPWFSRRSSPRGVEWWLNPDNYQTDPAEVRDGSGGPSRENTHCMMWFSLSPQDLPPLGVDARVHRRWLGAPLYAFQPLQLIHPLLEQIRQEELVVQPCGSMSLAGAKLMGQFTTCGSWSVVCSPRGLPAAVISTVQTSTSSLYTAKCDTLSMWCDSNHVVPSRCELGRMVRL